MNELAKTIELQLNPNGLIDKNIVSIINILYKSTNPQSKVDITATTQLLVAHSKWLLKEEWERVKYEAQGSIGKVCSAFKGFFGEGDIESSFLILKALYRMKVKSDHPRHLL
jgi:hypothetical protein